MDSNTVDKHLVLGYFKTFEKDWDAYGADPISDRAIAEAYTFWTFCEAHDIEINLVSPTALGGVLFDFLNEEHNLYFGVEIDPDGRYGYILILDKHTDARVSHEAPTLPRRAAWFLTEAIMGYRGSDDAMEF